MNLWPTMPHNFGLWGSLCLHWLPFSPSSVLSIHPGHLLASDAQTSWTFSSLRAFGLAICLHQEISSHSPFPAHLSLLTCVLPREGGGEDHPSIYIHFSFIVFLAFIITWNLLYSRSFTNGHLSHSIVTFLRAENLSVLFLTLSTAPRWGMAE